MDKFNIFSPINIILFIFLLVVLFLIYKNYQQPLNSKTYMINIYLYTIVATLFVALAARYISTLSIVTPKNFYKFLILYLIIVFSSFFIMLSSNTLYNHFGFLLFLFGLSLVLAITFKYSDTIPQAALFASGLFLILTMIVFFSSEETLLKLGSLMPSLTSLLCLLIIVYLIVIMFYPTISAFNLMSYLIIILFVFITLSDTSILLLKSKNLVCDHHSCVNYPLESTSLILDYLNIFLASSNIF